MRDIDCLHRKTYKIEIEISKNNKKTISYKQATLKEILRMIHWFKKDDHIGFLSELLSIQKSRMEKISTRRIREILEFIMNTYAKGFFGKTKKASGKSSPISSSICSILQNSNETLSSLLEMTWEQISFLVEGMVWNSNELTKKGKAKNKFKMAQEEFKEEVSDDEAIKIAREMKKRADQKRADEILKSKNA